MGLNPFHVLKFVVRPALDALGPRYNTLSAEQLVLCTAAHESEGFKHLLQLPQGPALGLWQMEPITFFDMRDRFLLGNEDWRVELRKGVLSLCTHVPPRKEDLMGNLLLAAAFCRVKYATDRKPLPAAGDVAEMAAYWKRVYNTAGGKGKVSSFINAWQLYVVPAYAADRGD